MRAGNRHQEGANIEKSGVNDVSERAALARRAEETLETGDCSNNCSQKDGMVLARIKLILSAEPIGSGKGTELRPRQIGDGSRTNRRAMKGDTEGIVRADTEATGSRARLQTTRRWSRRSRWSGRP
jgi:hypothetical protein